MGAGLGEVSGELSEVDFEIGDDASEELEPTSVMTGKRRGPEGPTMTEVGTKLDLARAYVDMGDPDGARSILNEVLEEGDSSQRQEARRLLDDLTD
jgi:pilus assembly protein FimV